MYVYQVYPSREFPLALVRARDGLWETSEVYSNKQWQPSARAATIFSLHSHDDGEYVSEEEALTLTNQKNIDSSLESWVSTRKEEADGQEVER